MNCSFRAAMLFLLVGALAAGANPPSVDLNCRCFTSGHGQCLADRVGKEACQCTDGYKATTYNDRVYYCECPNGTTEHNGVCALPRRVELNVPKEPVRRRPPDRQPSAVDRCLAAPTEANCTTALKEAIEAADWNKVAEMSKASCQANVTLGCRSFRVAAMQRKAAGDGDLAATLLDRGCTLRDTDACLDLAELYERGELVAKDAKARMLAMTRACDGGSGLGCYSVALTSTDAEQVRQYLGLACDGKLVEACLARAAKDEDAQQYDSAVAYARKACELSSQDCSTLGVLFIRERGPEADRETGMELIQNSCIAGSLIACERAGKWWRFLAGEEVASLWYNRAADLYAASCDEGRDDSCISLAELYGEEKAEPRGIKGSRARRATDLLIAACDKNIVTACSDLAFYYSEGAEGFKEDLGKATHLFEQACRENDSRACLWLAEKPERSGFAWNVGRRGRKEAYGLSVEWPRLSGGPMKPSMLFGLDIWENAFGGDPSFMETRFRFQSSFTAWQPLGLDISGGIPLFSWPRADRSSFSLLNPAVGFNAGGLFRGFHKGALQGWIGPYVSQTVFMSCHWSLRIDGKYQWWSDSAKGLAIAATLTTWPGDQLMSGVNHDRCGPVLDKWRPPNEGREGAEKGR